MSLDIRDDNFNALWQLVLGSVSCITCLLMFRSLLSVSKLVHQHQQLVQAHTILQEELQKKEQEKLELIEQAERLVDICSDVTDMQERVLSELNNRTNQI